MKVLDELMLTYQKKQGMMSCEFDLMHPARFCKGLEHCETGKVQRSKTVAVKVGISATTWWRRPNASKTGFTL
jgi:hypothetical protein